MHGRNSGGTPPDYHETALALCRKYLWAFNERMLKALVSGYERFPYITLMAQAIEDAALRRTDGNLVITLPPRHLKSYTGMSTIAWYLGTFPDREVMLVTHSESLSRDLAAKAASMMRSEEYHQIFPGLQIRDDRQALMDFRTKAGGGLKAGGFGTRMQGRGADLLIMDDALSPHEAESKAARESVINAFESVFSTRGNNPATKSVISIGHRVHPDDLQGHLLARGFEHLNLPFKAEQDEHVTRGRIQFHREKGEVLQPSRHTPEIIAKEFDTLAPHIFATQFQQRPTARESGVLKAAYFPIAQSLPPGGETIFSWDCASSTNPGSSFSVSLVFQKHGTVSYLKHISRVRLGYVALKELALALEDRYQPTRHLIEATSTGISLASELRARGANVIDINTGGFSKEARLDVVMGKIAGQYVHIVAGMPGIEDFLDELTAFPHGSNNDQVDALTQYLQWLTVSEPMGVPDPVFRRIAPRPSRLERYRPKT
ncbi:hypothetical protein FJ420_13130 [Mesorhizobium sp. B3-1-3]|uniref:hypothetical protein n=1 Tax=unclassified Mesorhizobium TaxID=325217 RepID=UPI00112ABEF2|nr:MULTISPECIES: hypothetical protein [unclassified Mesorhizobium]TPI63364.1 hypothetical protein FJ424_19035 [Mesorhizobium sp. B3-1-8]TPI72288.1 hypothetical protein FJ420_13130 [Mesorhizobium sp. B3-1-3]